MKFEKLSPAKKRERIDRYIRQKRYKKLVNYLMNKDFMYSYFEKDERLRIIEALAEIKGKAAVPTLITCYNPTNIGVHQQILKTLATLDTPVAVKFIARQLLDDKFTEKFKRTLYDKLKTSENKECLMPLNLQLIAPANERRALAELLHDRKNRYKKIIIGDEKDYERYAKLHFLEFVKNAGARYDIQDKADQLLIIQALGTIHKRDAVDLLIKLLEKFPDQTDPYRLEIIKALGFSKVRSAIECLYQELEKSESYVLRAEIIKAIRMFRNKPSVKRLERFFISPPYIRRLLRDTIDYLGEFRYKQVIQGDREDFNRLIKFNEALFSPLVKDEMYRLKNKLRKATDAVEEAGLLYELGDENGYTYLIEALGNDKGEVRKLSAAVLSTIGYPEYEAVFQGEDEQDFFRLGDLDYKQYKNEIMRIFNHCSQENRRRIVKAFSEYQDHPINDVLEKKHRQVPHHDHSSHEDSAPEHIDKGYTIEEYNSGYKIYNYEPHGDCYTEHQDTPNHQDSPHTDVYKDLDIPDQKEQ